MALSNDEKSKILSNDEKALDQSYKSPIALMGKKRYLGHTNEIISKKLQFILIDFQKLEACETIEELEKLEESIFKSVKGVIPKIIEPFTEDELKGIGAGDIKEIKELIDIRAMKRMGIPKEKIEELVEIEKKELEKQITKGIENLKGGFEESGDFPEEKNPNKE